MLFNGLAGKKKKVNKIVSVWMKIYKVKEEIEIKVPLYLSGGLSNRIKVTGMYLDFFSKQWLTILFCINIASFLS